MTHAIRETMEEGMRHVELEICKRLDLSRDLRKKNKNGVQTADLKKKFSRQLSASVRLKREASNSVKKGAHL